MATEETSANTQADETPAVEVRNLVKAFGGVCALDSVSLTAKRGEVTAIVGENGAGKSTLVKCLTGLYKPDLGEIRLGGEVVDWDGPLDARDAGIETVYQDLALADQLDVAANVFLGRERRHSWLYGRALKKREMRKRAEELLKEFEVRIPSSRVPVSGLSGGQRQGVSIARAALWGARLVIMDEPTAALGVRESRRVLQMVSDLAERGRPVILISHNMDDVLAVSDYIWVLRQGKVAAGLKTSETTREEVVAHITGLAGTAYQPPKAPQPSGVPAAH